MLFIYYIFLAPTGTVQPQQVSCVSVEGIRGSIFAMATMLSFSSGLHLDADTVLSTNISNNNSNTNKQKTKLALIKLKQIQQKVHF